MLVSVERTSPKWKEVTTSLLDGLSLRLDRCPGPVFAHYLLTSDNKNINNIDNNNNNNNNNNIRNNNNNNNPNNNHVY